MMLFDLDGTLVDTAPDLALALNIQRQLHGLEVLPEAVIRPYASHGSRGLLQIGFGLTPDDEAFEPQRIEYLNLYEEVFTRQPRLFAGYDKVLNAFARRGIAWGIVTNKPRRFSAPLIQAMGLDKEMACLVCGDDAAKPKPAPDTLLMACAQANVTPEECIYVGDAERDIQAGRAAGMKTLIAMYGYLDQTDQPDAWHADGKIYDPMELMLWI